MLCCRGTAEWQLASRKALHPQPRYRCARRPTRPATALVTYTKRSNNLSRFAERELGGGRGFQISAGHSFCQPEIENFDLLVRRDHDVSALQIAVYDSVLMSVHYRSRQLHAVTDHEFCGHRSTPKFRLQRFSRNQFHGDECLAVDFSYFVDLAIIWMVQLLGRSCLAQQTALGVWFSPPI